MPVDSARDPQALVHARGARELAMAVPELDAVEEGGDALDAVLVAGEEDVVGQLTRAEADVVLPLAGGDRDAGIHGRQRLAPSCVHARFEREPDRG